MRHCIVIVDLVLAVCRHCHVTNRYTVTKETERSDEVILVSGREYQVLPYERIKNNFYTYTGIFIHFMMHTAFPGYLVPGSGTECMSNSNEGNFCLSAVSNKQALPHYTRRFAARLPVLVFRFVIIRINVHTNK